MEEDLKLTAEPTGDW